MSAVMELSIAAELDGGCSRPTPALPGPPLPRQTRRQARPRGVEMAAEHPFSEARGDPDRAGDAAGRAAGVAMRR
jgi:hypothetical protein